MKPETLTALLIDRELGELPRESSELLDAYLEAFPAARLEAEAVARAVCTAREAVRAFPGLARVGGSTPSARIPPLRFLYHPWLARAAALIAVAGSCTWFGYHAGVSGSSRQVAAGDSNVNQAEGLVVSRAARTRLEGLWTQYQVAYDGDRKTFAVEERP
jgi:hypothetical protein